MLDTLGKLHLMQRRTMNKENVSCQASYFNDDNWFLHISFWFDGEIKDSVMVFNHNQYQLDLMIESGYLE